MQIWFARLHCAFADSWTIRRIDADDDDDNHHDVDADDDDNADDADEDADYWERAPLSPPTLSWKHGVGPTLVLIMLRPTLQSNSIWVYLICTIWTYIWVYFFLSVFLCLQILFLPLTTLSSRFQFEDIKSVKSTPPPLSKHLRICAVLLKV